MKKRVTVELLFDDETFSLNAITYNHVLNILKKLGIIDENAKPELKIKIEVADEKEFEDCPNTSNSHEASLGMAETDFEELYNRIATEREKLELKRLKRHEKLQRLIHKRPHHKAYVI